MDNSVSVVIADDHLLIRQGLKKLLNKQKGINVIGYAIDGLDAVNKTLKIKPDILLLDINMPVLNGLHALIDIKRNNPNQKVIMLTIHDSKEYIEESINLGADGFISKGADVSILKDAILRVNKGEVYIQPTIVKNLITPYNKYDEISKDASFNIYIDMEEPKGKIDNKLTKREMDVLREIVAGKKNKEIADDLGISEKTIRNHLYSIFKKLKVEDRTQAAIYAMENKLIDK